MGKCKCPEAKITSTDWKARFLAAKCVCNSNARLHAEENGRKITVCGDTFDNVDKVKVDGGLIAKEDISSRCDYFFGLKVNDETELYENNLFVELKGCDIEQAYAQIIASIKMFRNNGVLRNKTQVNGAIVGSHIPKAGGKGLRVKAFFKRDTGGTLHIKENTLSYDIVENRITN
jgi:hypothetical protein